MHRMERTEEILDTYGMQDASVNDYEVLFLTTNPATSAAIARRIRKAIIKYGKDFKCVDLPGQSNCESRNSASKQAIGERLLFIDGDQLIHSSLFRKHIELVKEGQVGIGIFNIDIDVNNGVISICVPSFKNTPRCMRKVIVGDIPLTKFVEDMYYTQALGFASFHNRDTLTDYINFVTRNVSIWKSDFDKIGRFDLELGYSEKSVSRGWEDNELGLRAYKAGLKFVFVPSWAVHIDHSEMRKDGGVGNMYTMIRKHLWFLEERIDWFKMHGYNREKVIQDLKKEGLL